MLVIDANIVLEVLYRRSRWKESKELLDRIKRGELSACMLQFAVHGISVMLGKPELVSTFLREILSWRGLEVRDLSVEEEVVAAELAREVGLDFDDGLHYYLAKKVGAAIVSFDKDFDDLDMRRLEPLDILT